EEGGAARVAFPLLVEAPAGATAGAYRVSVYENGSLVGSVPVEVLPLPSLVSVTMLAGDDSLVLVANLTARGVLHAELTDGQGATTMMTVDAPPGVSNFTLAVPSHASILQWSLSLSARPDARVLDSRNGSWSRAAPALRVTSEHVSARLPASWSFDAPGWDLRGATGNVTVVRWDGAPAPVEASYLDGTVRVEGQPTLEAGRYSARLDLLLPNGTPANYSWTFDAAPWLRVTLGSPIVVGREARVPLMNDGGVPIGRLVVDLDAPGNVTFESGGRILAAHAGTTPGRWVISDVALAPGGNASLIVRLPDGPLRAGAHSAGLRVLALAEAHV
ncbi:MAG: hypothetical protein WDA16_11755, partial [Candidatus Thermoplasmatota archaeon]